MQIPPLRIIRLLHTIFVSMQQQKRSGAFAASRLDALFYSLARYFGSSSLNMTSSLQVGLTEVDSALLLQIVGSSPSQKKGDGQSSCCISLTNEFDMSTVRNCSSFIFFVVSLYPSTLAFQVDSAPCLLWLIVSSFDMLCEHRIQTFTGHVRWDESCGSGCRCWSL